MPLRPHRSKSCANGETGSVSTSLLIQTPMVANDRILMREPERRVLFLPYCQIDFNGPVEMAAITNIGMSEQKTFEDTDATPRNEANAITYTPTNSLVVSHLLHGRLTLTTSALHSFLSLVNNPDFNHAELTLSTPSDLFAYDAAERHSRAFKRSNVAHARHFPQTVLANVVDIIEGERPAHSKLHNILDSVRHTPEDLDPAFATLSAMSLVHRSWTRHAQMAIGRRIILPKSTRRGVSKYALILRALASPLLGPWTTSAYISDCTGTRNMHMNLLYLSQDESEPDYAKDVKFVLAELLKLLPNLKELTIVADWMVTLGKLFIPVVEQMKTLKYLRELVVLQQCNAADDNIGVVLADILSELPLLKRIELNEWDGLKSTRHHRIPISGIHRKWFDLRSIHPSNVLENIEIVIGDKTSVEFVEWLFRPFKTQKEIAHVDNNEARAKLKKCSVIVSTSSDPDTETAEVQPVITSFVMAISPKDTFTDLQELKLELTSYWHIPANTVPSILQQCHNLRTLHISHGLGNTSVDQVLHSLPSSLEHLIYSIVVPHNELSAFDALLANTISSPSFIARRHPGLIMKLPLIEEFFISAQANAGALVIPGQLTTLDFALSQPTPTLHHIPEASAQAGVTLKFAWGRSVRTHEWISADSIGTGRCHWYMLNRRNTYVYEITAPVVH